MHYIIGEKVKFQTLVTSLNKDASLSQQIQNSINDQQLL